MKRDEAFEKLQSIAQKANQGLPFDVVEAVQALVVMLYGDED